MVKKDEYKAKACEFENESDCEEEMDEEGLELGEEEKKHFEEEGEELAG